MAGPLRLLDFPDEILSLTAGYLELSRRDLCAFACVCVRISEIADCYCYRRLLISSQDQLKRLLNAVVRRPQRLAFIREVILVPAIHHATNTVIDLPYFMLVSANMLRHLTVELPFHGDYEIAASLETEYQNQMGELFEDASLVSCIPQSRPFQRLRSCKLNFQREVGRTWSFGKHTMVFLHNTLESLTLVAASLGPHSVSYLRHHKKLTTLSRLHLDHCDVSPQALEIILSVPRALQSLEFTEYNYGNAFQYAVRDVEQLVRALSPQEDSLKDLQLCLRFHRSGFQKPYDFRNFTSLQKLTMECQPLDKCSLALKDSVLQIMRPRITSHLIWIWVVLPERPFCFVLQTPPGHRLDAVDDRTAIENLGRSLSVHHNPNTPPFPALETRLIIVRQTRPRDAVPPYLYNEHVPEKVVCYDSFASGSNWDLKTDKERKDDEDCRRLGDSTPFPDVGDGETGDLLLGQLDFT